MISSKADITLIIIMTGDTIRLTKSYMDSFKEYVIINEKPRDRHAGVINAAQKSRGKHTMWLYSHENIIDERGNLSRHISKTKSPVYMMVGNDQRMGFQIRAWPSNTSPNMKDSWLLRWHNPSHEWPIIRSITIEDDGIFPLSERELSDWASEKPQDALPFLHLASYKMRDGIHDQAMMLLDRFLSMAHRKNNDINLGDVMQAYRMKGNMLSKHDANEGIQWMLKALWLDVTMPECWCDLGDIMFSNHDIRRAKACYEHAMWLSRLSPSMPYMIISRKRHDHPAKMIRNCIKILEGAQDA